jgi:hypothetical protein
MSRWASLVRRIAYLYNCPLRIFGRPCGVRFYCSGSLPTTSHPLCVIMDFIVDPYIRRFADVIPKGLERYAG